MGDTWYAAPDGNPAGTGVDWDNRVDTITAMIALGWAAGDRLLAGPGVYREEVLIDGNGAAVYDAGTVTVVNESTTVTGTNDFTATPVLPGDQLFIGNFETQADGAYAAGQFTSAGANFQAGMVGYRIEVVGQGQYIIASRVDANTITLTDVNGVGFPGAGPYTYYITSGEGPYEVDSITDATHLELVKPWSGPDLTGLVYKIYRPVYLIGDVSGTETDGIGGVVRITGSDDDETTNRALGISADTDNYWMIRGFRIDTCTTSAIYGDTCTYFTIEDCVFADVDGYPVNFDDSDQTTVRRCIGMGAYSAGGVYLYSNPVSDNGQNLLENLYLDCGGDMIIIARTGGTTIKNCTSGFASYSLITTNNQTVGTGVFVHDCLLHNQCTTVGGSAALEAAVLGQIIEQYNNLFSNVLDRKVGTVGIAANSTTYPYLPSLPLMTGRTRNPMVWFAPSQWDETRDNSGLYPKNEDLFGVHNEVSQTRRSWGAIHNYATVRSTTQFYGSFAGSLYMEDAMEQQFVYPVKESWGYTVTVWVYLEANYAGNTPVMTVKQPGETTVTVVSTGAIGSWEQLSTTFTTGANLDFISVGLKSRNTAAGASVGCFFQDLNVN